MKTIVVSCGTCRHPEPVAVLHVEQLDSDCTGDFVSLKLKPRHWLKDTFGDGQWHGWVVADRSAVAPLLYKQSKS